MDTCGSYVSRLAESSKEQPIEDLRYPRDREVCTLCFSNTSIANNPAAQTITEEKHKSISIHFFVINATKTNDLARNLVYQILGHSPPQSLLAESSDNTSLRLARRNTCKRWKPLQSMPELLKDNVTVFIVIDALDECEETKVLENRTMIEAWNLKCTVNLKCTSRGTRY